MTNSDVFMESYLYIIRLYAENFAIRAITAMRKFLVIHQQIAASVYPKI